MASVLQGLKGGWSKALGLQCIVTSHEVLSGFPLLDVVVEWKATWGQCSKIASAISWCLDDNVTI